MDMPQHLRNPMVVEEAMKKAEPLAKQMGLSSIPDDMLELICPNLTFAGQFTPGLYARFQSVKQLLKSLSEQHKPKHGHIVNLTTQYASYEEAVLLLREGEIRGENLIASVGGKNLDDFDMRDYGIAMHVGCGGPFNPITDKHIQTLFEFDMFETTYNFLGAYCGNGMIEVTVPMKRWFLTLNV
ncbi:hypothetical protein [Vibrio parahaemolyticus]|uniref:hypothetical protein n=1 Tax=Vibrio parahaemolyticus TaxID=670 RepID=UPI0012AC868E|nr:hypothetical protein [Vibrio parahaemolyticus]